MAKRPYKEKWRKMLDWLDSNTDLIALLLAVLGLALGLFTVWLSVHQSRLNAYTRMHEMLISPEVSGGRRMLHLAHRDQVFPGPDDADWTTINQSLAVFDTLGVYMRRKIVSERLVLYAWHHPICRIREPSEAWLRHRESHGHSNPWPNFIWLLDRAESYHAKHADKL